MSTTILSAVFTFMLLAGYVLVQPEHKEVMRAHPCWNAPCNW
jgi:hypothetical protein